MIMQQKQAEEDARILRERTLMDDEDAMAADWEDKEALYRARIGELESVTQKLIKANRVLKEENDKLQGYISGRMINA